jgi:PAS domain S-box-containing protein
VNLRTKLFWVFVPSVVLFLLTVHFISRRAIASLILQDATERGATHARELAAAVSRRMSGADENTLLPYLHQAKKEYDSLYATVFDPDGRVLADTNVGRAGEVDPGARLAAVPGLTGLRARRAHYKGIPILDISFPVEKPYDAQKKEEYLLSLNTGSAERYLGTVRVGLSLISALRTADSISRRILWIVFLGCAVGGGVLLLFLRGTLRSIGSLVEATRRIAAGDLQGRVDVATTGEIGELGRSFNKMTEDLNKVTVSRDYIDGVFSSMTDTLIITDMELNIENVNQAVVDLLEYPPEELVGRSLADILRIPGMEGAPASLIHRLADLRNQDAVYLSKSGREVPVSLSLAPLKRKNHPARELIFVATDVSALARSNKELEQFAYFASHDLQEPLRKVVSFGDRLRDRFARELGPVGLDYLDRMQSAVLRMKHLIEDLLQLSRITRTKDPFEPVDLDRLIREILGDFEEKITQAKGVVAADPLGLVLGSRVQLRQLFQNLLENALKYSRKDTPPRVSFRSRQSPDGYVEIDVQDNGIGFEAKFAEKIFEPFQRLHNRSDYPGNGIGLAICRKVIQKHGGEMRVKSAPGEGATFTVRLPAVPSPDKTRPSDAGPVSPQGVSTHA